MLPEFELYMPTDLMEACALKAQGAKPVAGGTDVYVNMHAGKNEGDKILDIKRLKELQGQRFSRETGLDLGALTSHRRIEEWHLIKERYYAMFQGCSQRQRGLQAGAQPGHPGGQHYERRPLRRLHRPHAGA